MARGGKRQGTPGKAYANRNDLAVNRAPETGLATPAAGGVTAPAAPPPQPRAMMTPDDTPNLMDPGNRSAPLSSGLATGPGAGPAPTPPGNEVEIIAKYLPSLQAVARREGAPDTFKALVRYLQGA